LKKNYCNVSAEVKSVVNDPDCSEAKTRQAFIDKALKQAGWGPIVRFQPEILYDHCAVEEYPTASGRPIMSCSAKAGR